MEYTRVGPGLPPVHGARAGALILGSFPSPKSREQGFFYGHPQNRFWPLLAALTGAPAPAHGDIAAKKRLITENGLALWDVIRCCSIRGASDASIRDVEPNAIPELIAALGVQAVFCNGAAAARLYARYIQPAAGLAAVRLPSTSPANAACAPDALRRAWVRRWPPGCPAGQILKNCKIAPKSCKKRAEKLHPAPVCIIMAVYGRFAVAKSRSSDIHSR